MNTLEALREAVAGSYDIEREVGQGGMARVYLARDKKHDRQVALKVISSEVAVGMATERFLREIQICARLTHPHILPLLDSGTAGERPYFVMPYVAGESIRDRLKRVGQFPIDEAVTLTRDVADALDYAHAAGVLHRDVKPENVLLLGNHAVVLDFGVGRALSAATEGPADITVAGMVVGTPAYMSPEQAAGEANLDGRSDEYGLAAMLFEMITGEQPFKGPTAQAVISKRFFEDAPSLAVLRADSPPHVAAAVAKGLARDPNDRYPTVGDFGRALAANATATTPVAPRTSERPSIAVVPFANVGGNPDNEYLSDGITDEVISALSRLRTLRVTARTSSYAIRGLHDDIAAIGARLKVESLLEGSVQRAGNRIRVKARLVKVADGFQRWSEQFDRELDDIFAIQDAISAAIVQALEAAILGGPSITGPGAPQTSAAAYELYLKGRYFWNKRTETGLSKAVELFTEAVGADPKYAVAYSGLADAYCLLGVYGVRDSRDVMPLAQMNAASALSIDPSLAEAHATLAFVAAHYEHDWATAEAGFARALTLDPSYVLVRQWRASALFAPLGRFKEAIADLERGRAQDPLSLALGVTAGMVQSLRGDSAAASATFAEVIAIEPHFWMAHYFRAAKELRDGAAVEAIADVLRAIALSGGSDEQRARFSLTWMPRVASDTCRRSAWRRYTARCRSRRPRCSGYLPRSASGIRS